MVITLLKISNLQVYIFVGIHANEEKDFKPDQSCFSGGRKNEQGTRRSVRCCRAYRVPMVYKYAAALLGNAF